MGIREIITSVRGRRIAALSLLLGLLGASALFYFNMIRPMQQDAELNNLVAQATHSPSGAGQLTGGRRVPAGVEPEPTLAPTSDSTTIPAITPAPVPDSSCDTAATIAVAGALGNIEIQFSVTTEEIMVEVISNSQTIKEASQRLDYLLYMEELYAVKVQEALSSVTAAIQKTGSGFDALCVFEETAIDSTSYTYAITFPEAVFDCPAQIAQVQSDMDASLEAAVSKARAEERARPVKVVIPPSCFTQNISLTPDKDGCYDLYCPEFQVFRKYSYAAGVGYRPCGS